MTADADEVDRIVDDWVRERPDLDFAPLQVFSRVGRLSKLLDRARRQAFEVMRKLSVARLVRTSSAQVLQLVRTKPAPGRAVSA